MAAQTVIAGKYRLDAPIGQGGMASVWRATHLSLDSKVAVKVLDVSGAKAARLRERFEREAKLAANIKHRNIVDILDFGVHDEHPYMVMELLEGESLGERLEGDTPITDAELFDIGAQVLGGLAAAHDAGVVHRDVKPDNVFLVRDADGVYPKLLDFGISRDLTPGKNDTRVTSTGVLVGTPLYMSPEQARGLKDVDSRTDLWSVGAMLYEALTGELPFESENMGDILIRIATEDMPPIQTRRPDLPDAAARVVMKALERDRDERWQDARAMREAMLAASAELGAQAVRRHHRSDHEIPIPAGNDDDDTSSGPVMPSAPRRPSWPLLAGVAGTSFAAAAAAAFFLWAGAQGEVAPGSEAPEAPTPRAAAEPTRPEPAAPAPAPEIVTAPEVAPELVGAPEAAPEVVAAPEVAAAPEVVAAPAPEPAPEVAVARPRARPTVPPSEPTPPPSPPPAEGAEPVETGFLRDLDY